MPISLPGLALLAPLLLTGQNTPLPVVQISPARAPSPPGGPSGLPSPERKVLAWLPGPATCAGRPATATMWRRPFVALVYPGAVPPSLTFRFRLDADGRPLGIGRDGVPFVPFADDIGPSLAASRFAPGQPRTGCVVTYTARLTGFADTPVEDLISYTMNPTTGRLPAAGWQAIYPAAATCDDAPRPAPLTQAFPDFDRVAGTPGVRDWTMFSYDLDAQGKPVRVRVLTGTGNRSLDDAGADALQRSRYKGGPRTGCRYPFWKAPAILSAPPVADLASYSSMPQPVGCQGPWVSQPPLRFPDAYRRRSVEGWAVIAFDVAPWGGTGNVQVIASEPSDAFGEQAAALIRAARRAPSTTGVTGCVDRVRFVMARPGMSPTEDPPEN